MNAAILGQSIINGLSSGFIYILISVGLTVIFSIMNVVQFSHGEVYMLGAYCTYYMFTILGLSFWEALPVTMFLLALVGLILERFFFRPFRGSFERSIIVSIALMVLLQTVAVVAFGSYTRKLPPVIKGVLRVGDVILSWDKLLAILFGILLIVLLFLIIRKTNTGKAMVAVSQDSYAAGLLGVNVNRISAMAMAIGCAMAAVAGSLMARILSIDPYMGTYALTKGIAVTILGGLGSIPGAVVGGLILGLIDGIVPPLLTTTWAALLGFVVIIIILLVRPRGLMGHE